MKKYWKYIKPYLPSFILGPIMMIVEVVGEVMMPKLMANIINEGVATKNYGIIISYGGLMIVVALLMLLGGVGGAYFAAKACVGFSSDLRKDAFDKIQEMSFTSLDKFSTGSLVTRLTNDTTQVQNLINMMLRMMLRAPGMLIGALIMAIVMNPRLAMVLLVIIPLLIIIMIIVIRIAFPRFKAMQSKLDKLNSNIQEVLTSIRVIKSFVREDYEAVKFEDSNRNLQKSALKAMKVIILMFPVMSLLMNATTLSVVWFGGQQIIAGEMEIGDLTAFITYITQILMSLMMVAFMFLQTSRAFASLNRIREVLDEKIDITDETAKEKERLVKEGNIEFKNVTFRYYKNSKEAVLDNVSLKIDAKSTVGIIGSTGSGKTTLVSMIPRLYDADEGSVLVDGVDVKDYSLYNLREGVGMVLQKNVLFSGSIEENLLWGNEEASLDELKKAAEDACANSFIENMKDGYSSELDQGGSNVSGGQKQRLCIARALLKKPKILILDDSTSAVDTATEKKIRESFYTTLKDTTKIIIAQRISSIIEADMIVVLDDGKIVGQGSHDELIESCEAYKEIYYSQMDKKNEEVGA
ncbi:MAG: ABC transporter ATP-binding protein/permease [Lachnospiraceae bacterium]|nr:ABC transporter ATP-binding protein/permease [Lachnospiraceae bacterium]